MTDEQSIDRAELRKAVERAITERADGMFMTPTTVLALLDEYDTAAAYGRAAIGYERAVEAMSGQRTAWRTYAAAALDGLISGRPNMALETALEEATELADAMVTGEMARYGEFAPIVGMDGGRTVSRGRRT